MFDTAKYIKQSVADTTGTIVIGIILAVLVVYLFIGNLRSTIITGIAIIGGTAFLPPLYCNHLVKHHEISDIFLANNHY